MAHGFIDAVMGRVDITHYVCSMVTLGEVVALDERLQKFYGNTGRGRLMPYEPARFGHMVTQLCCRLEDTRLPLMVGFHLNAPAAGEEWGDKNLDIWRWVHGVLRACGPRTIVVCDSMYCTPRVAELNSREGVRFLAAGKTNWLGKCNHLVRRSTRDSEGAQYVFHKGTHTTVVRTPRVGPRQTTALMVSNVAEPARRQHVRGLLPQIVRRYHTTFSICGKFNRVLADYWWPYGR